MAPQKIQTPRPSFSNTLFNLPPSLTNTHPHNEMSLAKQIKPLLFKINYTKSKSVSTKSQKLTLFEAPYSPPQQCSPKNPNSKTRLLSPSPSSTSLLPSPMAIPSSTTRPKNPTFTTFFLLLFLLLLITFSPSLHLLPPSPSLPLPPPSLLKIAVFSRTWPSSSSSPGGMERHALTLHSSLSLRGHQIHIFTSSLSSPPFTSNNSNLHFHLLSGRWRCDEAFSLFQHEHSISPFDAVHSESVSLFHRYAPLIPNLAVSWHGISLESLHSSIYQHLLLLHNNNSLASAIFKVIDEIRFFQSYAHHVAISHSAGEILRDVYQIPSGRVHVILNGVDEKDFRPDFEMGMAFREEVGVPEDAELVMGVAGRLVKDKGHPLVFQAMGVIAKRHPKVL